MKLSCLPVSLYDDIFSGKSSVADWIQFGAELGLDAVDFSIKFFPKRAAACGWRARFRQFRCLL
ncbi:MAG: hypothetical protein OXI24_11445, partial [Candidatus Poribacteria bacterium]|nr:hypothetical protein [Candidatus Poribacteria bacterium]